MRILMVLVVAFVSTACDPAKYVKFSVAPPAAVASDSGVRAETFALVTRIGVRNGLRAVAPSGRNDQGWDTCLTRETLFLCGKASGPEIHFEMRQALSGLLLGPTASVARSSIASAASLVQGRFDNDVAAVRSSTSEWSI